MAEIRLTSEITVEYIQHIGSDLTLFAAAKVLHPDIYHELYRNEKDNTDPTKLLKFLMEKRHGTPFEHSCLSVYASGPSKIWWEWVRHRIAWSYNLESSRYKDLEPVFYIPPRDRPAIRPKGFKSMRPEFDVATDAEYFVLCDQLKKGYAEAYSRYEYMLNVLRVDRGLAMMVLGQGIYFSGWATANPRSIMSFLELRTHEPGAKRPSHPLYEIEVAARKLEAIFAQHWPITHRLWNENGRMAP